MVSGSQDKTVRVWEKEEGKLEDGHCLPAHNAWIVCMAIDDDGKVVVSGSDVSTVWEYERQEGKWDYGRRLTGYIFRWHAQQ